MGRTKKISISSGEVEVKELTFGEENNATRKAFNQAVLEGKPTMDIITKKEFLLLESIVSAPFKKDLHELRNLSRNDGLLITSAFNELNEVMPGELKNSEQASSKENTQKESSEDGLKK